MIGKTTLYQYDGNSIPPDFFQYRPLDWKLIKEDGIYFKCQLVVVLISQILLSNRYSLNKKQIQRELITQEEIINCCKQKCCPKLEDLKT